MKPLRFTLVLLASAIIAPAALAQDAPPPTNQEIFAPLDFPAPTDTRAGSGRRGPGYWQQRADYRIEVTLDTASHGVTGVEGIAYTNNSPDSLEALWLHLPQNLFAPNSRGALVNPSSRWRGAFAGGGMQIKSVELRRNDERITPDYTITDTRMRIPLERPLPGGGGRIVVTVQWSFIVPEYGADRMGRFRSEDGWVYEIAQWYPRMAVYDDVNGWNPMPYLGQGEFYLEYGNF
ncbi:MAG: M1 family metallopeptidase, partial [Gemmatimonadales bacterium]